jgi:hypothetical protein
MPATSKLFEYIRPLIAVSVTITFVLAAHTISFGDLRSVPEMCKLQPVAFEFDFPEDQSAVIPPHNGDPGILRWLVVRNLTIGSVKLYGVDQSCDAQSLSDPTLSLGAFQEGRVLVWTKSKVPSTELYVIKVFHSMSSEGEYLSFR